LNDNHEKNKIGEKKTETFSCIVGGGGGEEEEKKKGKRGTTTVLVCMGGKGMTSAAPADRGERGKKKGTTAIHAFFSTLGTHQKKRRRKLLYCGKRGRGGRKKR